MLRGLMLLLLVLVAGSIAIPFVTTSRALEEHGIILPGSVYHKDEYVRIVDSGWELSRTVTIQYTVPESSSITFFEVHPDVARYASLHLKQAVDVRYLQRKDLPALPGVNFLSQLHALPTARLADASGTSRLAALQTPRII